MDATNNEKAEILKWMLGRIYRAEKRKKQLDERLVRIAEERDAPIGGVGYRPLPRSSSGEGNGAASIILKMSDIEERIYTQKEEVEKAIVRVMDILDYLPQDSLEREICELRHIDMKPWKDIQESIPMSRSQCNKRYNKAIEMLLNKGRIERMIEENEEAYTDWKLDKEWKMLKKSLEKQSGGIESGNKSGKYFQENQKVKAVSNADRIDRRKKKGMKTQRRSEQEHRQQYIHSRADKRNQRQRTGSGAHGGSESQYRRTGEQRQQRRRRRRQEAREGGKDTQEEQSGQTRQGAEAGQRET